MNARGKCPYCGRVKALTKGSRIWKHYVTAGTATVAETGSRIICGGSGRQV